MSDYVLNINELYVSSCLFSFQDKFWSERFESSHSDQIFLRVPPVARQTPARKFDACREMHYIFVTHIHAQSNA